MKIAVLIGRYPPVFGGATPTLKTLFAEMATRGHEVVFLTPLYSPDHLKCEFYKNIKVVRIPPGLNSSLTQLSFVANALIYILREKLDPEIIVDTIPYGISMSLLQSYAKFKGIPLVARLSQMGTNEPLAAKTGKFGLINRLFIHGYDFTICISTALEKQCDNTEIKKNKYGKIYNCVDSDKFLPLKSDAEVIDLQKKILPEVKRPIVVVPGSVSPRKRSDLALTAWRIIKQEYKLDGSLVFVGALKSSGQEFDNGYVTSILENVQKFNLQDSVFFTGQKENIDEYFKISDLLLFVSNKEGLPNVLLEGISCGLPIVCTEIKDITDDIFHNELEGLYTNDDPGDIAEKLSILMKDSKRRSEMSVRCVQRSRLFNPQDTANKIETILKDLVVKKSKKKELEH